MDRGGFKPKDTMVIEEEAKTIPELEAELAMLVGREKADILLGKVKVEKAELAELAVATDDMKGTGQHIN
jgi:hypothetical protein